MSAPTTRGVLSERTRPQDLRICAAWPPTARSGRALNHLMHSPRRPCAPGTHTPRRMLFKAKKLVDGFASTITACGYRVPAFGGRHTALRFPARNDSRQGTANQIPATPFTPRDRLGQAPGDRRIRAKAAKRWRTLSSLATCASASSSYTPGYFADHWCDRGHVLYVVEGEVDTELRDGRTLKLNSGMSYHVADFGEPRTCSDEDRRETFHRGIEKRAAFTDLILRSGLFAAARRGGPGQHSGRMVLEDGACAPPRP